VGAPTELGVLLDEWDASHWKTIPKQVHFIIDGGPDCRGEAWRRDENGPAYLTNLRRSEDNEPEVTNIVRQPPELITTERCSKKMETNCAVGHRCERSGEVRGEFAAVVKVEIASLSNNASRSPQACDLKTPAQWFVVCAGKPT
jgi:hypothetical protein